MLSPSTGEVLRRSWMSPRVMSGRSWSIAASMLATTERTRRRAESLLCSTRSSLSRWMVSTVEAPNPMMRTTTISTVIFAVSRRLNTRRAYHAPARGEPTCVVGGVGSFGPRASLHPGRATSPVRLAEHALDELPRAVPGQPLVEGDLAGHLVVRQVPPAEGADLVGAERLVRAQLDGGVDALTPLVVGHAEHCRVLDLRMSM